MWSDLQELTQSIYIYFKQNKGQWWANINYGLPYIDQENQNEGMFDNKGTTKARFEYEINKALTDNFKSQIIKYSFIKSTINTADRVYHAVINLVTIYGTIEITI